MRSPTVQSLNMSRIVSLFDSAVHALTLSCSILLIGTILYALGQALYNIFLHPLRSYPGPFLWRASTLPSEYYVLTGGQLGKIAALHQRYGPEVRIGPNHISFSAGKAFREILAHTPGQPEFAKIAQASPPNGAPNILNANKEEYVLASVITTHY